MNRLLIEKIEGRILVGIVMFVSIMILIGWVAINEEARMASFVETFEGRSIERGAELFAANCTSCHGSDGHGLLGVAPGLHNPQLFGYNPFSEIVGDMSQIYDRIEELNTEREALIAEIGTGADAQRVTEIQQRIEEIDLMLDPSVEALSEEMTASLEAELPEADEARAAQIERMLSINEDGSLTARLVALREERDSIISMLGDAFIKGYLPGIDALLADAELTPEEFDEEFATIVLNNGTRTAQVGWENTVAAYIRTTLVHGRPGSGDIWNGNIMAAWSQLAGGPLRDDELDYLVAYITNWDLGEAWAPEDLLSVNQFGKRKMERLTVVIDGPTVEPIGTDVDEIMTQLADVEGDPVHGEAIYTSVERPQIPTASVLGCSGCHVNGAAAPDTVLQWELINTERLNEPQFAGYTAEQYIVESIVQPSAYVVDGYVAGTMPQTFGDSLSIQDLADIIAYIRSFGE